MNKLIVGAVALGFFGLNGMHKDESEKMLLAQMRALVQDPRAHETHIVAQKAAAHCIVLFKTHAHSLPRQCRPLLRFCKACPEWLQSYVNAYVFMNLMAYKQGCRCQDLGRLTRQADPEYLDEITGLPETGNAVLKRAIQDRNSHLALYALAMGADVYKVTCESACSMCSTCHHAPERFVVLNSKGLSGFLSPALRTYKKDMK